jgi:hypothetical protein
MPVFIFLSVLAAREIILSETDEKTKKDVLEG